MPLVDIIVPVYNVKPYLKRCLDSIISQTFGQWRAICVDDGSTDGCAEILDSYASSDNRFKVIHKRNGGLSDARNVGVENSDSEFIMFVDSDDFIHPQTLEIAVGLARRDGSDIVTWYRDAHYRNHQLKLCKWLGLNTICVRPWGMKRTYDLQSIRAFRTDNLIEHCTDWNHAPRYKTVKHCYVWRHLFKREVVADVKFIKGIYYEDIPWWSEVILKPMKATITELPLYYYYNNPSSISRNTSSIRKSEDILRGLLRTYGLYEHKASERQMELWSHNFKWSVLFGQAKTLQKLTSLEGSEKLRSLVVALVDTGALNDAVSNKELAARRIFELVASQARYYVPQSYILDLIGRKKLAVGLKNK